MTRYKAADFADDDTSSVGSIQLAEAPQVPSEDVRYKPARRISIWKSRNLLEKCLILIIVVLLVLLIILACLINKSSQKNATLPKSLPSMAIISKTSTSLQPLVINYNADENKICVTENCVHAASNILRSIDRSVDPCQDFYAYSCNQWIKNNPIPDGKSLWGTFGKLEQQNHVVVKNVLDRNIFKSNAERKAKAYYVSCMDEDEHLEKLGGEPLKQLIREIGGWNITDSGFDVTTWTLQNTLQTVQNRFNMGGLFSWAVGEDDRNSSRYVIQIDQGGLTLPTRDHYLNTTAHQKVLIAYFDYMNKVGILLGADSRESNTQMREILNFETRIAEITTPSEQRHDEEQLYHALTVADLQLKAPFINWHGHFENALDIVHKKLSYNEKLVIYAPEYLEKLTQLVLEYSSTEKGKM